jgi:hypothetical protein
VQTCPKSLLLQIPERSYPLISGTNLFKSSATAQRSFCFQKGDEHIMYAATDIHFSSCSSLKYPVAGQDITQKQV